MVYSSLPLCLEFGSRRLQLPILKTTNKTLKHLVVLQEFALSSRVLYFCFYHTIQEENENNNWFSAITTKLSMFLQENQQICKPFKPESRFFQLKIKMNLQGENNCLNDQTRENQKTITGLPKTLDNTQRD